MRKLVILLIFLVLLLAADLTWIWLVQHNFLPWQAKLADPSPLNVIAKDQHVGFFADNSSGLTIRWGLVNEPPFHINDGPEQDQGFCDVVVERLQVYLADVRHITELNSQDNLRQRLYRGDNVCLPCSILQPADDGRLYSKPLYFVQSHGIIVRSHDAATFRQRFGEPINFDLLLQSELRFARPAARRFGPLQPTLERYQRKHRLVPATQLNQPSMQMLHWLAAGQTDYVLDYISTLHYFSRHSRGELTFIPIANLPQWLPAASSCPDTQWGQAAILRINAAAEHLRRDKTLQQSLQQWFSPALPAYPMDPR